MAGFPFTNLHSFSDYVVFVQTYAPDRFRPREGVGANEQWTLELAFEGLRRGLDLAKARYAGFPVARAEAVVSEAYEHYRARHEADGFSKLEELRKLLRDS